MEQGARLHAFALLAALLCPGLAMAQPVQCLFEHKGKAYIDGTCERILEDGGVLRLVQRGAGKKLGYFVTILPDDDDTADGYWNGSPGSTHAHDSLGKLRKSGDCWENRATRVCATRRVAEAGKDDRQFRSPSGNIHCIHLPASKLDAALLRCDITDFTPDLHSPRPQAARERAASGECEPSKLSAFEVAAGAQEATFRCPSDEVASPLSRVLPHGATWSRDGFSCQSSAGGMKCSNSLGHGFFLSRTRQHLF